MSCGQWKPNAVPAANSVEVSSAIVRIFIVLSRLRISRFLRPRGDAPNSTGRSGLRFAVDSIRRAGETSKATLGAPRRVLAVERSELRVGIRIFALQQQRLG